MRFFGDLRLGVSSVSASSNAAHERPLEHLGIGCRLLCGDREVSRQHLEHDRNRAGRRASAVRVYDAEGRPLRTRVDRILEAGRHTTTWRPRTPASGLYLYRVSLGGREPRGGKMLLLD